MAFPSRSGVRRPRRRTSFAIAVLAVAAWCCASWWFADVPGAHRPLPERVRWGFVLDGQSPDGNRVAAGLRLLRAGRIDTLAVSGVPIAGGVYTSMIWVRQAPLDPGVLGKVFEMRSGSSSTMDEARVMDDFFRRRGIDSALVVTSDFHVWRAASIFEKVSDGGIAWFFHGAPDSRWNGLAGDRERFKSRLMEWTKRASWSLWERWKPVDPEDPIRPHGLVGGPGLGRLPEPAWNAGQALSSESGRPNGAGMVDLKE